MALGHHERVGIARLRVSGVEPHLVEEEDRHDLRAGHARRGVSAARRRGGGQRMPPEAVGHFF